MERISFESVEKFRSRLKANKISSEVISSTSMSLESQYSCCLESFTQLSAGLTKTPSMSEEVWPLGNRLLSSLLDEMGRFRVWAASTGADHKAGEKSLDSRLQEAPHVHQRVTGLLKELDKDLQEGIHILTNGQQKPDWHISLEENSDSDTSTESKKKKKNSDSGSRQEDNNPDASGELENILADIEDIISNLYQLSTTIKNPAPRDRLKKLAGIDPTQSEIALVREKFPEAPSFLVERLARANAKRRQLLICCEKQHLNTMTDIDGHGSNSLEGLVKGDGADIGEVSRQQIEKAASTALPEGTPAPTPVPDPSNLHTPSGSGPSVPQSDSETPDTQQLECHFCGVVFSQHHAWKKHVINHLHPYVCPDESCSTPDRLFDSEDEWFEHGIRFHWGEWFCECCSTSSTSRDAFERHLFESHPEIFLETDVQVVIDRCKRQKTSMCACPLCPKELEADRVRKHLSQHLHDIVCLILPPKPSTMKGPGSKVRSLRRKFTMGRVRRNQSFQSFPRPDFREIKTNRPFPVSGNTRDNTEPQSFSGREGEGEKRLRIRALSTNNSGEVPPEHDLIPSTAVLAGSSQGRIFDSDYPDISKSPPEKSIRQSWIETDEESEPTEKIHEASI